MIVTTVNPSATHVESCASTNNIHRYVVPTHLLYQNHPEDARFSEPDSFGRLHADLRDLVRRDLPTLTVDTILTKAVEHLHNARFARSGLIPHERLAFACADLAVTGNRACFGERPGDRPLMAAGDLESLTDAIYTQVRTLHPGAVRANVQACARELYRRVYRVAWTLFGPLAARARFRAELGWIAVSGEDDSPRRPVNVPASQYPQYDVTVDIPAASIGPALPTTTVAIRTRCVVAARSSPADAVPADPGSLPAIAAVRIPPRVGAARDVILFVHGHSSRAEEFEDIAPLLLADAAARGRELVIVSLDLPCNGYSQMFDSAEIVGNLDLSSRPDLSQPTQSFPALRFLEEFLCRFIETLGLEDRILAIIGGSLGGNMTLRLGRTAEVRRSRYVPNLVSWSAASVWDSFGEPHNPIDAAAKRIALDSATASLTGTRAPVGADGRPQPNGLEDDTARAAYFHNVFLDVPLDLIVWRVRRQPEHWYRDDWNPCKSIHIQNAILDRQEMYCRMFRQTHWRIALEQLLYSHNLREGGRPLYERNLSRMLFLAGSEDNYDFTKIYDATQTLAGRMAATPGECALVANTGHSIHNERPRWFSAHIIRFLIP